MNLTKNPLKADNALSKNERGIVMSDKAKVRKDGGGYWIYIRWEGVRHYITNYMGQLSFRQNRDLAYKSATVINSEIDKGIFRPERWKYRAKKLFNIEGYFENWIEKIRPDLSTATAYDYTNSFKNHIIPIMGNVYIEDLGYDNLLGLMNKINRSAKGKKNVMGALKTMLRYAYRSGHIPTMPIFPEFRGKNTIIKQAPKWVEPKEQISILEGLEKKYRPIYTFIMLTGCRPSEARAFRRQDIRNGYIVFAVTFGRKGEVKEVKGKKVLPFPLTEALKELLNEIPVTLRSPYVFLNPNTGKPYGRDSLNRIFNRVAKRLGIKICLNEWGRKSFANQMLKVMDRGLVSHLLRHQDPRMIEHYAEYQTDPIKSILDKLQAIYTLPDRKTEVSS